MAENKAVTELRRTKIQERASIADMGPLRHAITHEVGYALKIPQEKAEASLSTICAEARDRNLEPLYACVEEILDRENLSPKTRQTFDLLMKKIAEGGDVNDLLPFDGMSNPSDKENLIPEIMLTAILRDPELRPILMDSVDEIVKEKSDNLLNEIDELAKDGKRKVLGMGIIGGGPLTSLFLTAAGPFVDNVLITDQERIGEPWRSRLYIYVNTDVKGDINDKPPLPHLGGAATPIVVRNLKQAVHLGFLTDDSDLKVGEESFLAGGKVGDASALNCLAYADNFLVGQRVIPEQTRLLPNGNKLVVIQDVGTRKIREIEVDTTVFLTGPGNEFLPLYDAKSREDYQMSMFQVDKYIENVRQQLKSGETVKLPELPRILTGTALEKLLRLWVVDLKRNPDLYPLAELFDSQKRIGVIGGGDSGKTCNEFLGLKSPPDAYPPGFKENAKVAKRDAYKFQSRKKMWSRYEGTAIDSKTRRRNIKAATITLNGDEVSVCDTKGKRRNYDFVFVSLGYERQAIEAKLSDIAKIPMGRIRDIEGEPVALGYEAAGVYIGGSAMGYKFKDYPIRLQEIIEANESEKDPISLWINAILTERLAYSVIYQRGVSVDKVRDLYQHAV